MKHIVAVVLLIALASPWGMAQQTKPDPAMHEQKVRDMVAFLEYVLNTLGSAETSARDKDVLIRDSYTKIFRDSKVQVEDDLDDERKVITNKDVQAYLKDVDFFFEDATFDFNIKNIKGEVNANGELFYKVSIARNLKGTTVAGTQVNKTIPRYIEINFNTDDQDLKIVSIYTNVFDESRALKTWWSGLSYEWQSIFRKRLGITYDSLTLDDIKNITSIDALDVSNNRFLQTIEPLGELSNLKTLNLAGSGITDLTPIRNLTGLIELDVSGTQVDDLTPLKYSDKLQRLMVTNTLVNDISILEKMPNLQSLDISGTDVLDISALAGVDSLRYLYMDAAPVSDLTPLSAIEGLVELIASRTLVRDLTPLSGLKQLEVLNLDSTYFENITALRELTALRMLSLNNTSVANLRPLSELEHLERIYCDHTGITRMIADDFMASRPGVLVIFDSELLQTWWTSLTAEWRNVLRKAAQVSPQPTKEELARVTNLDSINFSGNIAIQSLEPLEMLQKLKAVVISNTTISDLSPLRSHRDIRFLDISSTRVEDLSMARNLRKLRVLNATGSKIPDVDPVLGLTELERLYVDNTNVTELQVQELLVRNPDCLVVYKSDTLETWWEELSPEWQEVLQQQVPFIGKSRSEDLHRLVELEKLDFSDPGVDDLAPLTEFVRLKELHFSGTGISDLSPLADIVSLTSLKASHSPVRSLEPLNQLSGLAEIDISNTPVEDLDPLSQLQNLKSLNCSGTQIMRLDALEELASLEQLDCSNTRVRRLDAVTKLKLKSLKCYNTSISNKRVEHFVRANPECNVVHY